MNYDYAAALDQILQELHSSAKLSPEDIPSIDLYMDQVTSLMEDKLRDTRRYEQDKILTKTMINNYAKNHLLPAPEKKKYNREHILMMVFIYYFKSILSLQDIQTLMDPLCKKYYSSDTGPDVEEIYREVFRLGQPKIEQIEEEVRSCAGLASEMFADAPSEDRDFLQFFALIGQLSMDIYMRRRIVEKLIDSWTEHTTKKPPQNEKKHQEEKRS